MYELVGGMPTFTRLAEAFYRGVETDPLLRPLYPKSMWDPRHQARRKAHAAAASGSTAGGAADQPGLCSPIDTLAAFLAQFFGGPRTYSDQRGHPRLKMRHVRFKIGQAERDAWFKLMCAAIEEVGIEEPIASVMRQYFDKSSTFLINSAPEVGS